MKDKLLGAVCPFLIVFPILTSAQGVIEEVIVTAQKRAQSLQDVAGSISAFGASQIEKRGITEVEDLFQAVPGLNYSEQSGSTLITIRGIGLSIETGAGEPGVATHVDGVYQPRSSMDSMGNAELERVEVLRGPQGTLYGRNSTGGVVNFITKKPTESFEGSVKVGYGSWNKKSVGGYVSGPLVGEVLLGRLSASHSKHDGYVRNLAPGDSRLGDEESTGVRGALRWLPTDSLKVDLSASFQSQHHDPLQQLLDLDQPSALSPLFGGIPGLIAPVISSDAPNVTFQNDPFPRGEKETTAATLTVEWDVSDAVLFRSITGYGDHETGPDLFDSGSNTPTISVGNPEFPRLTSSEYVTQEFNLSGSAFDDDLQWILGAYYFQEDYTQSLPASVSNLFAPVFGLLIAPGLAQNVIGQDLEEDTESVAAFVDVTYSVSDTFRVNVGLRQNHDTKDTVQFLPNVVTNITGQIGLPTSIDVINAGVTTTIAPGERAVVATCAGIEGADLGRNTLREDSTSPKLRFEWDATDELLLFAQWQEGFKSGGANASGCDDLFEPEEIVAYEIGFKSTLLEGALTFNGSFYRYDYDNLQVFNLDETGTSAFIANVTESEVTGGELELNWVATDSISIDASLSFSDSEITKADALFDTVTLLNNLNLISLQDVFNLATGNLNPIESATIPLEGNPIPRNPELTWSLGINYDYDSDIGGIGLRGEVYFTDDTHFRFFGNPEDIAPSYTVYNFYLTYTTPSGFTRAKFFAKNFSDEEYLYNQYHALTVGAVGIYAPPRHFGIELTHDF